MQLHKAAISLSASHAWILSTRQIRRARRQRLNMTRIKEQEHLEFPRVSETCRCVDQRAVSASRCSVGDMPVPRQWQHAARERPRIAMTSLCAALQPVMVVKRLQQARMETKSDLAGVLSRGTYVRERTTHQNVKCVGALKLAQNIFALRHILAALLAVMGTDQCMLVCSDSSWTWMRKNSPGKVVDQVELPCLRRVGKVGALSTMVTPSSIILEPTNSPKKSGEARSRGAAVSTFIVSSTVNLTVDGGTIFFGRSIFVTLALVPAAIYSSNISISHEARRHMKRSPLCL
jgi:hypothetical protein